MQYIVTAEEICGYDSNTIEHFNMPCLLLMERAALFLAEKIQERFSTNSRILVLAGSGNNGGDGIAAGRILSLRGYHVTFCALGDPSKYTNELLHQLLILKQYKIAFYTSLEALGNDSHIVSYDIIVDALLGIGAKRNLTGKYLEAVCAVNKAENYVVSVDIPSGIHADTGKVLGDAVHADLTVSFSFHKWGQLLYPGCEYTGELCCGEIGITKESFLDKLPGGFFYDEYDLMRLPTRNKFGNKGDFGKLLLIAGSDGMSGACQLSGKSAFRSGIGKLMILTAKSCENALQINLPEAILSFYQPGESMDSLLAKTQECLTWANCIAIGPGIGNAPFAKAVLAQTILQSTSPLILDADALNLLSVDKELLKTLSYQAIQGRPVILTPHLLEFSRISGFSMEEIKEDIVNAARKFVKTYGMILICKDAKSIVCTREKPVYLNTSGNHGMATAGSGDVLTGIVSGLVAQGMEAFDAACLSVYLHGKCADSFVQKANPYSLMASDLTEELKYIMKGKE